MIHLKLIVLISFFLLGNLFAIDTDRYWIFFSDKNSKINSILDDDQRQIISARALKRREIRGALKVFDETDKPVSADYIRQLKNLGIIIHHTSRWLNAVSCYLNGTRVQELEKLNFVKKIQPVKSYIRTPLKPALQKDLYKSDDPDYGPSFNQNNMIGIPTAHSLGFHGEGVLIAVFDTGFILEHEALKNVEVTATWDFINGDDNVENESGDLSTQHNHGTEVLSVLAGYQPGNIIGPAYASHYILAKTEDLKSETHAEEDNWIAAAEWAESLGADIISSSVGYILDYTYEDMDGNTTLITRAADLAVRKGVAVFSSAGNEGSTSWKYVIAPADGDSVIAIGGVLPDETFWNSSSRGPTADGRIKPDLLAQAQGVYTINPQTTDSYKYVNGNSYSCPLAAGVGAVLYSTMPGLTPIDLRDLLIQNASHYDNPDNQHGYGLIDLEKIFLNVITKPGVSVREFMVVPGYGKNTVTWIADREIDNNHWIISRKSSTNIFQPIIYVEGREAGISAQSYIVTDDEVNGNELFTYTLSAQLTSGTEVFVDSLRIESIEPSGISLLKNAPNPFNHETKIVFGLDRAQKISLKIYNILGQKIRTLIDWQFYKAEYHHLRWNGINDYGNSVNSGTYFLQLVSEDGTAVVKLLYIK